MTRKCSECSYGPSYDPSSDFCDGCISDSTPGVCGATSEEEEHKRHRRALAGIDIYGSDGDAEEDSYL